MGSKPLGTHVPDFQICSFGSPRSQSQKPNKGRVFEAKVEKLLARMQVEGTIIVFVRHPPFSPEDHDGRDFTVSVRRNGEIVTRSFGVSISRQSVSRAKRKHPNVPQLYFSFQVKEEAIIQDVLALFT